MRDDATPAGEGYVGRSVRRVEDQRLLTGAGRYVADIAMAGLAHLVVVRSIHAAADIRAIDLTAARAMPGVLGIWTGADFAAEGHGGIPWEVRPPGAPKHVPLGDPDVSPPQQVLAHRVVRYVGEPVVVVVAETVAAAEDAAEAVVIDYAPQPSVTDTRAAAAPGAIEVWARFPGNVCFRGGIGDPAATDAAFARADHVVSLSTDIPRLVQNPMETRGYVGSYDPASGRFLLQAAAGKPATIGRALANDVFRIPEPRVRVVTRDVGGGFGAKNPLYPEAALVLWTAQKVGRPVRWICGRTESFCCDLHARDHFADASMALDRDGRILGLRVAQVSNLGAYLSPRGATPPTLPTHMISGMYAFPALDFRVQAIHSHTMPTCTYRGAGAPEAVFVVERLIDQAARDLGIAPGEIRRRNLVPKTAFPYRTPMNTLIDSGDFVACMDEAERLADLAGFAARRAASRRRGRERGIGYANILEACGMGIADAAEVLVAPGGGVTVNIGTMSNGQSHETVYAQMLGDVLGIALERIAIRQGDSDDMPEGMGTGASRSMSVCGSALVLAGDEVIKLGLPIAADLLEAAAADIEYARGEYRVVGTDRVVKLEDVAAKAEADGGALKAKHRYDPTAPTFPNGCHIAEVEVDPETGQVFLVGYSAAHDVGRALNPMVVEGQLVGGVVQGVGEALCEIARFDAQSGQLLTGSFMDYAMPRADEMPDFRTRILEIPCTTVPTGMKAVGEAGPTAAPAAILNAIVDALYDLGVRHLDMPATPEAVFRAIQAARKSS